VLNQANNVTEIVSHLIKNAQGVSKFHTTGISIDPITRWDNSYGGGESVDIGFEARNTISFNVLNTDAGALLSQAVTTGSPYVSVDSVNFVASDHDIAVAQAQAIEKALIDSTAQATFVLNTLGLCQDHISSVNVMKGSPSPPVSFNFAAKSVMLAASVAPVPISGGNQDVTATVTLTVAYKPCTF